MVTFKRWYIASMLHVVGMLTGIYGGLGHSPHTGNIVISLCFEVHSKATWGHHTELTLLYTSRALFGKWFSIMLRKHIDSTEAEPKQSIKLSSCFTNSDKFFPVCLKMLYGHGCTGPVGCYGPTFQILPRQTCCKCFLFLKLQAFQLNICILLDWMLVIPWWAELMMPSTWLNFLWFIHFLMKERTQFL